MAGHIYMNYRYIGSCLPKKQGDGTFNGLMFAPGNCWYTGSAMQIDSTITTLGVNYGLCTNDSYNSKYGLVSQSSYFNPDNICSYFGYSGSTTYGRTITNTTTVSYGGYNDWRVPTKDELSIIINGTGTDIMTPTNRAPGSVNGNSLYSFTVAIIDSTYGINYSNCFGGIVLIPSNTEITTSANITSYAGFGAQANQITLTQLSEIVSQGGIFVRHHGGYYAESSQYWYRLSGTSSLTMSGDVYTTITWPVEIENYMGSGADKAWYMADVNRGDYVWQSVATQHNILVQQLPLRLVRGTFTPEG